SKKSGEEKRYWNRSPEPFCPACASRSDCAHLIRLLAQSAKGGPSMYRDVAQWSGIRDRVLRKGVSIRQVSRETGISPKTIRKMLDHSLPQPHRLRRRRYPKLGPHKGIIERLFRENATLPPSA